MEIRSAVSRRRMVAAGLGLAAAACGPAWARGGASSRASLAAAGTAAVPVAVLGLVAPSVWTQPEVRALEALDSHVEWWAPNPAYSALQPIRQLAPGTGAASPAPGGPPAWAVSTLAPYTPPPSFADLTPALKQANFDATALVPGALRGFSSAGKPYAVPIGVVPTGLFCNVSAFQEAGISLPAAGWTLADFDALCLAMRAAIRAGKVRAASSVFPPLVGSTTWTSGRGRSAWYGGLLDPTVWGGFVLGYGGTIVDGNGMFDLTNAGAIQGLNRLLGIAREYGAPQSAMPDGDAAPGVAPGVAFPSAMVFAGYPWAGPNYYFGGGAAATRWIPFPAMPDRPVVPATLLGVGVLQLMTAGRLPFEVQPPLRPAEVPLQAKEAAVAFARWLYERTSADPTLPGMPPPLVLDAKVQDAYWATRGGTAARPPVAWRDLAVVQADWPTTGLAPEVIGGFLQGTTQACWIVFEALTQAALGAASLPDALAAATRQLNAAAAARTSGLGGA